MLFVLRAGEAGVHQRRGQGDPKGFGGENLFGQVQRHCLQDAIVREVSLLIGDDLLSDLELAEEQGGAVLEWPVGCLTRDEHVLVYLWLRVVHARVVADEHQVLAEIEPFDQVALAEVKINGARVRLAEHARLFHGSEDGAGVLFDDDELLCRCGAQADRSGWGMRLRPGQAGRPRCEAAGCDQSVGAPHPFFAEVLFVGRRKGDLVGGGLQVRVQDMRVGQVDDGFFDRAREQAFRLSHEELVQGVLAGHQDRPAVAGAAGPAPALQQAGHRAREPCDQRDIQAADVDPQL